MSRNYYAKRTGNITPNTQVQEEQSRRIEETRAATRAYEMQDLPEVLIKEGQALCPYASCGYRQRSLEIGVQTCTNNRCERKFRVPDNTTIQRMKSKLAQSLSRRQEREAAESGRSFGISRDDYW